MFGLPCGMDYTATRCEPSLGAVVDCMSLDKVEHALHHPRSIDRALPWYDGALRDTRPSYDTVRIQDLKSHGLRVKSCVDHVKRRSHPWNCEVARNPQRDVRYHDGHDLALEDARLGDGAGQLSRLTLEWFNKMRRNGKNTQRECLQEKQTIINMRK